MTDTTDTQQETPTIEDPAAVLAALDKAKKEAKKFREERDALRKQVDDTPWKDRAIKAELRSTLAEMGIKDTQRLMKYVDTESISVDDEGNMLGVSEAIDAIKGDFPEIFDPKRRAGGKADLFADSPANMQKTASQKQAELLLGA